jgi:hypothetical protein
LGSDLSRYLSLRYLDASLIDTILFMTIEISYASLICMVV